MVLKAEVVLHLKDWLNSAELSYGEFGERIERSAEAVRRYANGDRIPDRETMPRIAEQTLFKVTANDFFGIDDARQGHDAEFRSDSNPTSSGTVGEVSDQVAA